jgi:hypothetical protein
MCILRSGSASGNARVGRRTEDVNMAMRIFVDSTGREWHVYDVVPRADERRHYDRRAPSEQPEVERRGDEDRRLTVGRRSSLTDLGLGWLLFDSGDLRKRLAPIPENWVVATDAELERYAALARPVRRVPTPQR